jgi:hypothetical protein
LRKIDRVLSIIDSSMACRRWFKDFLRWVGFKDFIGIVSRMVSMRTGLSANLCIHMVRLFSSLTFIKSLTPSTAKPFCTTLRGLSGGKGDTSRHTKTPLRPKNELGGSDTHAFKNLSLLALVLRDQGRHLEAGEMNRQALEGREKLLGLDHPDTLTSINNLAGVLQYQGMYEKVEVVNRWALAGREKLLGREHPDTLTSVSNLA